MLAPAGLPKPAKIEICKKGIVSKLLKAKMDTEKGDSMWGEATGITRARKSSMCVSRRINLAINSSPNRIIQSNAESGRVYHLCIHMC